MIDNLIKSQFQTKMSEITYSIYSHHSFNQRVKHEFAPTVKADSGSLQSTTGQMAGLLNGNHCRCDFGNIFDHENNCKSILCKMESDAHDKTLEGFCEKCFKDQNILTLELLTILSQVNT